MGNALEDIGRIRKLVINWRLCGRYLRLKQKFKRQKKCLDRIGAVHAGEIRRLKESKKREIDRLEQIVLTQQTKIEIIQRESADRVMEALRLVGTGYALRETDEKIRDLRFEKFEEQKREENYPVLTQTALWQRTIRQLIRRRTVRSSSRLAGWLRDTTKPRSIGSGIRTKNRS
jgi:hypothetical protein